MDTYRQYRISVLKPMELMEAILSQLPLGAKIYLEGYFNTVPKPTIPFCELKENPFGKSTPPMDLWLFNIDEPAKQYLSSDYFRRIGLRKNVVHLHIVVNDQAVFSSHDNFDRDGATITETRYLNYDLMNFLIEQRIISNRSRFFPGTVNQV